LDLLPARSPQRPVTLTAPSPPAATARGRVALLRGCVQSVLAPELERCTVAVLHAFGWRVEIPAGQGCCGGLALHAGDLDQARALAARNLNAFDDGYDAIVTNAAGCGSALRETATLFAGSEREAAARRSSSRARDVSSVLAASLGDAFPGGLPPLPRPLRAVYHDPCHLQHAQGERRAPRTLLRAIPNLELVEPRESEICCGSAGTYNFEQPALADRLGERKARALLATGAEAVITGNLGCALQIRRHAEQLGRSLEVLHTVEVVAAALAAEAGDRDESARGARRRPGG
ncbi:MAG TPA: (Fe-S)-binding protein, partial [Thermoanaerobaculia bacterium]|nr:(Fe-S)-binding protein [Thermoanaerobaculia bacterium]